MKLRDQMEGFHPERYYELEVREPITFRGGQVTEYTFNLRITKRLGKRYDVIQRMLEFKAIISHALYTLFHDKDPELVAQVFVDNPALDKQVSAILN